MPKKDDAAEGGLDNGEVYKGNSKSSGVPGMLDVIKSDFERTMSETEKVEDEAQQGHVAFKEGPGKIKERVVRK